MHAAPRRAMETALPTTGRIMTEQHTSEDGADQALSNPLTATASTGLVAFNARRENIERLIDELVQAGLQLFEVQRQKFVEKMEGLRAEVREFTRQSTQRLVNTSEETQADGGRLGESRGLIQQLGLHIVSEQHSA